MRIKEMYCKIQGGGSPGREWCGSLLGPCAVTSTWPRLWVPHTPQLTVNSTQQRHGFQAASVQDVIKTKIPHHSTAVSLILDVLCLVGDRELVFIAVPLVAVLVSHLTCLTDLEVSHHSPLQSGWAWVTTIGNLCIETIIPRVSQCEGLAIEGNAHHKLPRISTFAHPTHLSSGLAMRGDTWPVILSQAPWKSYVITLRKSTAEDSAGTSYDMSMIFLKEETAAERISPRGWKEAFSSCVIEMHW
ncbi:hypothetical protein E2C01_001067 [Portunus trituberculatus]|uniref:Uncharacterized protein n=1 Tax=Portunus trituberculatus TaxID=210409 RepID=A0A5B7CGP0_PORTR|nr:hypothetical protein [Portunus trituberculatus]